MKIKLKSLGTVGDGSVMVTTEDAVPGDKVLGLAFTPVVSWSDGLSYTLISDAPELVKKLRDAGYVVDDTDYIPHGEE